MAVRLEKPWVPLTAEALSEVKEQLGVYELGSDAEGVLFIGVAEARSPFGLKSALEAVLQTGREISFRYEVNTAYQTRYRELLMAYVADHGTLPPENDPATAPSLGRLSPG